jgi:tetratricopeptide (TPR) repeat protein
MSEPSEDKRLADQGVQSWHAAEMDRAEELFRAALEREHELHIPETGSLLQWIAKVEMEKGHLERAREAFRDALEKATAAGDRAAEAVILLNFASLQKTIGETGEALKNYRRAAELADGLKNHRGHAHALGNIANVLRGRGELDEALKLREHALELLKEHGTARDMGNSLSNMGGLLRSMGRLRESEETYRRAIDYLEQSGATRSLVITHTNLARLHMDADRLDDAADVLTSAIAVAEMNELPLQQTAASVQMARLELKRGDADAAFELADEALDPRKPAAAATRIEAHIVAGLAGLQLGEPEEAQHSFTRAYESAKEAQINEFVLEALCPLAGAALDTGEVQEAARLLNMLPEVDAGSQAYARFALPAKLRLAKAGGDAKLDELRQQATESLKHWEQEGDKETARRINAALA